MKVDGIVHKLISEVEQGATLRPRYTLVLGEHRVADLHEFIGSGMRVRFTGNFECSACRTVVKKLYGGPYCYDCFTTLARCDLCVMSPSRCHYAEGTCREPRWGETFCMQPHLVYLANSSGPKVGITKRGRQFGRWVDQGASQAMVVAATETRRDAGLLETRLSRIVSDRTDWRRLVSGPPKPVDLTVLARQLQSRCEDVGGGSWYDEWEPVELEYPIASHSPPERLRLDQERPEVRDNLGGIKGQYLLMSQGAFNVADHEGFEVSIEFTDPFPVDELSESDQLSLF